MHARMSIVAAVVSLAFLAAGCGTDEPNDRPDDGAGGSGGSGGTAGTGGSGGTTGEGGTGGTAGSGGTAGAGGSGGGGSGGSISIPGGAITLLPAAPEECEPSCSYLPRGAPRLFVADVRDADGNVVEDVPVTWSSSDESLATVDAGSVSGLAPGNVEITAEAGDLRATMTLEVGGEQFQIFRLQTPDFLPEITLVAGRSATAFATASTGGWIMRPIEITDIAWKMTDPTVALVETETTIDGSPAVVVRALAEGTTNLRATSRQAPGLEALLPLTVIAGDVPAPLLTLETIAPGMMHACALDAAGALCWGDNGSRQLGPAATTTSSDTPVPFAESDTYVALTAGGRHTCARDATGSAWCWGANDEGQLGITRDDVLDIATPMHVAGDLTFAQLAAGDTHTCGLTAQGAAYCWGSNFFGKLGTGSTAEFLVRTPAQVAGSHAFAQIDPGNSFTCALDTAGAAWCWGAHLGALGIGPQQGDVTRYATPQAVLGGHHFTQIATGGNHTCAIRDDGTTWCWGRSVEGQLGVPATVEDPTGDIWEPVQVAGTHAFVSITAGNQHTCALDADGGAWCWGGNASGQLGTGDLANTSTPAQPLGGLTFSELRAGGDFTCGLATGGGAYCWGAGFSGQLGTGGTAMRPLPTPVAAP